MPGSPLASATATTAILAGRKRKGTASTLMAAEYYAACCWLQAAGPWGVSGWYSNGESRWCDRQRSTTDDESPNAWGIGGRYAIAPGWQIRADWNYIEHKNLNASSSPGSGSGPRGGKANKNDDAKAVILTNMFNF